MSFYEDITGKKEKETKKKKKKTTTTIPDWFVEYSKEEAQKNKKNGNMIVKSSSLWDDGYDFGDVTKTILSTAGDAAANVGKGFMNTIEGVVDTGRTVLGDATQGSAKLQAKLWEKAGYKDYAKSLRQSGKTIKEFEYENAKKDVTGSIFDSTEALNATKYLLGEGLEKKYGTNSVGTKLKQKALNAEDVNWSKKLNEGSVAGTLINSAEQGLGNMAAFVGLGGIGNVGASTLGLQGVSAKAATSLSSNAASTFFNSFTSAYGNTLTNSLRNGVDEKEAKGKAFTSGLAEAISEQFFQGIPGLKSAGWADKLVSKPISKFFSKSTGKIILKVLDTAGESVEEALSNILEATFEGIRNKKNIENIWGDIKEAATSEETMEAMLSALISSAIANGGSTVISSQQKNSIIKSYAQEHDMSVKETQQLFDSLVEKKSSLEDTSNFKEQIELEDNISKKLVQEMKQNKKLDLNELFNQTPSNKSEMQFALNETESKKINQNDIELANSLTKSGFNNTEKSHNMYALGKMMQDNNNSLKVRYINNEDLQNMGVKVDQNKTVNGFHKGDTLFININGAKAFETTIGHELGEAIKSASNEEYTQLKNLVKEAFTLTDEDLAEYTKTYTAEDGSLLTDSVEDEWVNDKLGELFENENLRNRIADNRTLLQKVIDNIKSIYNKVTGKDKQKLKTLKEQLEDKFIELYKNTDFSQGKGETTYALEHDKKHGSYWNIETGKDIFKDITNRKELKNAAFDYLIKGNDNFKIIDNQNNNGVVRFIRDSAKEYVYGTNSNELTNQEYKQKMRIAPSIDDLVDNAQIKYKSPLTHENKLFPGGYDNFQGTLKIDDNYFKYIVRLGIDKKSGSVFYDVSLENLNKQKGTDTTVPQTKSSSLINKKSVPLSDNIISQQEGNVNTKNVRYSLAPTGEMVDNKGNKVEFEVSEVNTKLPIRDENKLMVLHNLGENKMNGIMDLDGIPVPSLAITNPYKVDHSGFGEATLIFKKDTIDPANRLNEVYDRDVWSPTQPQIDYDIKFDDLMDLEDKIYNKHDAIAGTALNRYFDRENLSDNVDRYGIEGTIEEAKNSDELKYIYYKTLNPDFEILKKTDTKDLSSRYSNELLQEFNTQYGKEIPNWMNISDEQRNELINDFRNYWQPILEQRANEIIAEENAKPEPKNFIINMAKSSIENNLEWLDSLGGQDKLIEHLHEIQNNGGNREINDIEGTKEFVNNNINQEEYNKWVDDTLGNLLRNAEKGIYNGKDYITNNGRRTFKQLHDKYTLENLVKALTKGDTKGTQKTMVTGYGQIQAQMANRFESIEDIKNAENQIMSDEEAKALTDEIHSAIEYDVDTLADCLDGDYYNFSNASQLIFDYASKKTRNEEVFRKLAKDYANHGIPSELIQKITNDLEALKNMPTDYFEAKPQRAVGLDEIGMALIPNTWSEETKQRMKDKGIKYIEYDKSIEGERQRLEKELTDFMFSLTSNDNINKIPTKDDLTYTKDVELQAIAPIREDISNLSNQLNNLSNQIQTLQNGAEMVSNEDIAPVNPYRERAIQQQEANKYYNEMQKDDNYWKSIEENLPQTSELDEKSARKLARNIGKELGLKQKQVKDLQSIIQDSFDNGYSVQQIEEELYNQFAHQSVVGKNESVIEGQRLIRDYRIKVSPNIQKNIPDYGYWKQSYFGKIRFSNDGDSVDSVYQQLSAREPSLFPSDIWNETDELLRIAEVADMDRKYSFDYEMDDATISQAANYIHDTFMETLYSNAIKSQNDLENQALQYNENLKEIPVKKKTRQEVRENLQNTMGITTDDLQKGNDIKSFSYQTTTPERVNEKVFGREVGRKINEQTVYFAKHQEAERIRFLNKERQEIKDLGIKARSKESALVQQYGEGIIGDTELAQEIKDKATQEKIKNAARVLRSKYDTYLDQINEVLVDMGYDPIPKRKDYMRHFQELTDKFSQAGIPFNRQELNSENLPTDINGLTEFNVPGKNWFASAQRRTGEKTTYDAITGIDGYLEGASNLMYHTETIQRYRALEKLIRDTYGQTHGLDVFGDDLSSEEAMQRIQDIQEGKLSNYAAWLKEQGNAIAGKKGAIDRGVERALGRKGYTFLNTLKKQTGSNMTGFNVRSALTNFISSTIAASKTNKLAMVKGTVATIKNMFHNDGFIDRSDFLTSRLRNDSSLSKKTWQKISNAGQIFMSGSDWFTSNVITRSKYYEGLSKGMTEQQAMKYADDFGARVMGDRSKGATAEAFNSKTLGLLTQFQLETNNQWQYMIHDTKMEFQENLAKDGGLKAGATMLFQMGQLAAYSYLFNEMFEKLTGSRAAFDIADIFKKLFGLDDDDKDKDIETRMQEAASELMDALPFTSLFGSGGRLPIGEMLTPAQTIYDAFVGNTNKYGQPVTWEEAGKEVIGSIPYYVLPTGYGQIKKTAQGLGMYANEVPGSYTDSGNLRFTADTDTGSVIKNALFGQWSGEEAKKYRESGYKTIQEKDIPLMKDLGMTSSEFREFKTEMKEETTTTMEQDGVTYNLYLDDDGNRYWYDKNNKIVYNAYMDETDLSVMNLKKANANELKYNYVSNLPISENNKQKIFDELFTNTIEDKYGYKKYTDKNNKTYWYDEDNDTLYDSKYNKVNKSSIKGLKEVSESKNMSNYKDYGSYEEFDFAYKNPGKYQTMKAIANDYENYKKYVSGIENVRNKYSQTKGYTTEQRKKKVISYVNKLDLTVPQKAMLLKKYYPSFKDYNRQIVNYVSNLDLTYNEKVEILKSLDMKVDKKGNVTWK